MLKLLSLLTQQLHVPHTQEFLHLLLLRSELRRGDCVCPGLRALRRLHGRLRRLRGLHGRLHGARSWREQIQASKEIDRCLRDLAKITAHRKQFVVARIWVALMRIRHPCERNTEVDYEGLGGSRPVASQ